MSVEIPENVETVDVQKKIVDGITSVSTYKSFERTHFHSYQWPNDLAWWAKDHPDTVSEYFRLVGLVGIIAAQYGFPALDYTAIRHSKNDWDRPSADPMHQLALGIEIANWGLQAYPIKEKIAAKFEEGTPGWWGAWNVFIKTKGRRVPVPQTLVEFEGYMRDAQNRFRDERRIALPDTQLNERVAALTFTGDQADTMSRERFVQEHLPRVVEATAGWINPVTIFEAPK